MGKTLLVTRPEPAASATAAQLRALGYPTIVSPALVATALPPQSFDLPCGARLIVTSPQGARALASWSQLKAFYVLAVGDRTADLLQASGFTTVQSAGGDAQAILSVTGAQAAGTYCLLGAPSTGHVLARALAAQGHSVQRCDVYQITPAPRLTAAGAAALRDGEIGYVLFHSARSARVFIRQAAMAGLSAALRPCTALCLSAAVAHAVKDAQFHAVRAAATPTAEALQALLPALELRA